MANGDSNPLINQLKRNWLTILVIGGSMIATSVGFFARFDAHCAMASEREMRNQESLKILKTEGCDVSRDVEKQFIEQATRSEATFKAVLDHLQRIEKKLDDR
ncbi:MAG: hypothetical protein KOO60_07490 [Gemmatimonadales bacterium]|nr:hypothetical protein [Gemmatimonadales bacterium]